MNEWISGMYIVNYLLKEKEPRTVLLNYKIKIYIADGLILYEINK